MVGMELMRCVAPTDGSTSVFTLTTSSFPALRSATLAISGATVRQGPHQGAQKSTRTGKADSLSSPDSSLP